jgi:4-amino-4-deoxy-L-arabinose transferase-like glycosyltransferase
VAELVTTEPTTSGERVLIQERSLAVAKTGSLILTSNMVLALSVGIGALVRFRNINALGYNSDEAVYTGQAASLAGDAALSQFFPIFRAHPMVFQYTLSLLFSVFGVHDIIGRSLAAVLGLVTILMVYRIGADLYSPWTGAVAAVLLAFMPYHVIVTRQMLLDGPLTFCTTLTLLLMVRYALTGRTLYLMAVGSTLGLTFLTKETGFVFAAAVFAFLALSPQIRVRFGSLVAAGICTLVPIAMFPVSITLAGKSDTAQSYLVWQLLRPSNHEWSFFLKVVPPSMGPGVIALAIIGLVALRAQRTWRETLLVSWIVIPSVIFQIWSVKGFQYLLPIAPAVALLAARTLVSWRPSRLSWTRLGVPVVNVAVAIALALSLLLPSWSLGGHQDGTSRMAGAGGIPGVREMGTWIQDNVPDDAIFVAIGPSMANLIQFYGHRRAFGLSVSANPLNRNPSYYPLINPDSHLRYGDVQYLVYDAFTASRSPFFTETLKRYVDTYGAQVVFSYSATGTDDAGSPTGTPLIIIYEVRT